MRAELGDYFCGEGKYRGAGPKDGVVVTVADPSQPNLGEQLKLEERPFNGASPEHSGYYDLTSITEGLSLASRVRGSLTTGNVSAALSVALVLSGFLTKRYELIVPGLITAGVYRASQLSYWWKEIVRES